jgi:chromosomal replication initiation ATPase DnaA
MSDQDIELAIRDFAARKGMAVRQLKSPLKSRNLAGPRQELYYLLHMRGVSYPRIGWHLGRRDHSTVMSGVAKHRRFLSARFGRREMAAEGAGL